VLNKMLRAVRTLSHRPFPGQRPFADQRHANAFAEAYALKASQVNPGGRVV